MSDIEEELVNPMGRDRKPRFLREPRRDDYTFCVPSPNKSGSRSWRLTAGMSLTPETIQTQHRAVIAALAARFPKAFFLDAREVRPLQKNILADLVAELHPNELERAALVCALGWYRSSKAYVCAIALGKWRRDLRGKRVEGCDLAAREAARAVLVRRGHWTDNLERRFAAIVHNANRSSEVGGGVLSAPDDAGAGTTGA